MAPDELEAVPGDRNHVPVGKDRLQSGGAGVKDDGWLEIVAFGRVGKGAFQHLVLRGRIRGKADVGFGAAVTVAPVIFDDAAPHGKIGGFLVRTADGRPDGEALGVRVLAISLEHDLPRHFRNVPRVRGQCVADSLADSQWLVLCFLELGIRNEPEIMHTSQDIQLANLGTLGVGDRVVGRGRLGKARKHGGLGDGDVLERATEVDLGRGGEPVGALA